MTNYFLSGIPGIKTTIQRNNFHRSQQFEIRQGYGIPNLKPHTNGEVENTFDLHLNLGSLSSYDVRKLPRYPEYKPWYVVYDGRCLSFQGYFKQQSTNNAQVLLRKINLVYYLEDDTITVFEPVIPNAGYSQGKLVKRSGVLKPNSNKKWHWKDLNVGMDVEIYGVVYRLCSCDAFTKEFLLSQGIELNECEPIPEFPGKEKKMYSMNNTKCEISDREKLCRYLQFDGKVLRFYGLLHGDKDEREKCKLHYYLIDDTCELFQLRGRYDQLKSSNRILRRMKIPKNFGHARINIGFVEGIEYYKAQDFKIGEIVTILGKRLLIYDCDEFTRRYYEECLKCDQPPSMVITTEEHKPKPMKEIPPHTGFGREEDTLQDCLSVTPKTPKLGRMYYTADDDVTKTLRYTAQLDSDNEDDKQRKFVIQYSLMNGRISVYENKVQNSGYAGGYFLKSSHVPKFTCKDDKPSYYTPADFIIGDTVDLFGRKFIITGADLAVYRHMESNPEKFSPGVVNSVKNYLIRKGLLEDNQLCDDDKNEFPISQNN